MTVSAAVTFNDIRAMMPHVPFVEARIHPGLGEMNDTVRDAVQFLYQWQRSTDDLTLLRPRTVIYAATHGVDANSIEDTRMQVARLAEEEGALKKLCRLVDSELRIFELDLDNPTHDFNTGPAMSEQATAQAMAYGMMAVEPGLHALILGGVGVGGEKAASQIIKIINNINNQSDIQNIQYKKTDDSLNVLAHYGGYEMAAMVGAMIAARMAGIPVFISGLSALSAAAILHDLHAGAAGHVAYCGDDAHADTARHSGLTTLCVTATVQSDYGAAALLTVLALKGFMAAIPAPSSCAARTTRTA